MIEILGDDPDGALDALATGEAIVSAAVLIDCAPPLCVWSGDGTLTLEGQDFAGIASRGLVGVSASALGSASQNFELSFSGIEPALMAIFDSSEYDQASAVIWLLIFDKSATRLLGYFVEKRGRLDQILEEDTTGASSLLRGQVEGAVQALGRAGSRLGSDADQRRVNPNDGLFRHASYAGSVMLAWGGKVSTTAASALTFNAAPAL